jgi:hypothetical protein
LQWKIIYNESVLHSKLLIVDFFIEFHIIRILIHNSRLDPIPTQTELNDLAKLG